MTMYRYLIADFERSNFSIFQNSWTPNAKPQIVGIPAVQPPSPPSSSKATAADSQLAGISIGAISFLLLGIGLAFDFLYKKRTLKKLRQRKAGSVIKDFHPYYAKPELHSSSRRYGEMDSSNPPTAEADSISPLEMEGTTVRFLQELEGHRGGAELEGTLDHTKEGLRKA